MNRNSYTAAVMVTASDGRSVNLADLSAYEASLAQGNIPVNPSARNSTTSTSFDQKWNSRITLLIGAGLLLYFLSRK